MIRRLQKRYALSEQGAKDLIKGCFACVLQNISFMFPVGLLYCMVSDLMNGGVPESRLPFYIVGCILCVGLILLTTYFQYNATYFATYTESGVRRITLAERLRKIPLSFFGKKDLADLTSTIMADCTFLEQSFSHFIPELAGSIISTVLIAVSLFFYDWRMALAALWVMPVAFAIVGFSAKVQEGFNQKSMDAKMACADGIQECIETVQDLKANNAEKEYLKGLEKKIRAVEHRSILNEFGLAAFVVSASLVLKLGIATVALAGSVLLMQGSLDILTFFLFLLVVSRLYDPLQGALQNLAAVISTRTNIARMNEILDHPIQQGKTSLSNQGYDITFDHVGFAYNTGETVLKDVSFTANSGEILGIAGISGCGQKELLEAIAGLQPVESGTIAYMEPDGTKEMLIGKDPLKIAEMGVSLSFVPEDRLGMGLVGNMDLTDNMMLRSFRKGKTPFVNRKPARELAEHVVESLEVVTPGIHTPVRRLSGGNVQKVLLGREIASSPTVLLTAYAVRGLDINSSYTIYDLLNEQKKKGVAVIFVGEDLDVLVELSDRIMVLCGGEVSGIVDARTTDKNEVGMMMTRMGGSEEHE